MKSTFSILFYIKRDKMRKNGRVSIHARITINGSNVNISLKIDIDPKNWSPRDNKALGKSKESQQINCCLNSIRGQLLTIYKNLSQFGDIVTP